MSLATAYKGLYDPSGGQTRILFGENSLMRLPEEMRDCGRRPLLITSKTLRSKTDLANKVSQLLGPSLVGIFDETQPHTPRTAVLKAAELARSLKADCLVSLGGGSTTDTAKAVRLALCMGISGEKDFDQARARLQNGESGSECQIPQVCLPTTLVGAEYSSGMGITDEATRSKQVFEHRFLRCRAILLDPQLTLHTPPVLLLSTGIKSLEHAVARLSLSDRHPVLDATAALAVQILGAELPRAFRNPDSLEAHNQLQIGGWLSKFGSGAIPGMHMGLSHALGRQIGSVCGVPHGLSSCVILPLSMDFNASVSKTGLGIVARSLGIDIDALVGEQIGKAAADAIRSLIADMKLPGKLREIGVSRDVLPLIAERTLTDWSIRANPRPIAGAEEILAMLEEAW